MCENEKKVPTKIAVRSIILNDKNEILLTRRNSNSFAGGKWCLPGGKQDLGETEFEAAMRENDEEIHVKPVLSSWLRMENPDTSTGTRWITHYFVGHSNKLPDTFDTREISEVGFFSNDDLENLDIAFDHKEILKVYFKSK